MYLERWIEGIVSWNECKTEGKYGNSLSFSIPVIYPQNYFLLSEKTFEYFPDKDKGSDSGRYIYKDI